MSICDDVGILNRSGELINSYLLKPMAEANNLSLRY